MKIGEIVETLIRIRDDYDLLSMEDEAICEACNILDRLPRLEEYEDVRDLLRKVNFKDIKSKESVSINE